MRRHHRATQVAPADAKRPTVPTARPLIASPASPTAERKPRPDAGHRRARTRASSPPSSSARLAPARAKRLPGPRGERGCPSASVPWPAAGGRASACSCRWRARIGLAVGLVRLEVAAGDDGAGGKAVGGRGNVHVHRVALGRIGVEGRRLALGVAVACRVRGQRPVAGGVLGAVSPARDGSARGGAGPHVDVPQIHGVGREVAHAHADLVVASVNQLRAAHDARDSGCAGGGIDSVRDAPFSGARRDAGGHRRTVDAEGRDRCHHGR